MQNRLQFRHHSEIFSMKEDALGYIQSSINDLEGKFSLFAEPTVICYGNEEDPHLILAIGAVTNNTGQFAENRYAIIDIDATESEIAKVADDLEKAVKSLTILPQITDSLELEAEKTENGTILKGNVKLSPSQVIQDISRSNILTSTPDGLFSYVGLRYDEDKGVLTFMVNDKETSFKIANEYIVGGEYKHEDESIHLYKKSGEEIVISCTDLLDEWVVEGENTKSPVVLKKEAVIYGTTSDTSSTHALPWQDVLSADVRLSNSQFNILKKTEDKRSLEVEGVASNIAYFSNGQQITVKEALDELSTNKLSNDSNNLLYKKLDGFFASVKLRYVGNENALYFTTSNIDGSEHEEKILLNRVELFKDVTYDPTTESLKITYVDNLGSVQICSVPIGSMLRDWEWQVQSEGHTIALNKERNISGDDILTADAKISSLTDNILQDIDHTLYVKGTANNIKYDASLSVEEVINSIKNSLAESKETEKVLDEKIDTVESNLTSDLRNTESALNAKIDGVKANLTERIDNADEKIQELEDTKLNSIENKRLSDGTVDNSIEITTKDDKLAPQVNVRLSKNELNIIRTTADGVEAEVGLGYDPATNVLTFTTSNANGNKSVEYQLNTTSFVDDIKYDSATEEIVILYHSAGGKTQEVRVPVRDIVNEIDFTNTSTVKFTRNVSPSRGSDIVSADVIISPSLDNALSNVNGLFVSKSYFDDKINANANEIVNTKTNLENEIERATNAEAANATAISNEISRAQGKEDQIETDLANETSRAKNSEADLKAETVRIETRIETEETRAQGAESVINNELGRINNSISDLNTASATLDNKINSEVTRAKEAENTLQTNITKVANDLNSEVSRVQSAEDAINVNISRIDREVASLKSTSNDLSNQIANEVARAKAAESTLQTNVTAVATDLTTETNRAQAAEEALSKSVKGIGDRTSALESGLDNTNANLASEILRSQNKDAELAEKLDSAVEKIDKEVSRAVAKDESLTNDLNSEIARAKDAESTLQTNVTSVANDLTTETNRAKAAEEALSKSVNGIGDRTSALESGLNSTNANLASEILRSQNKDAELAEKLDSTVEKIDKETSRAVAKDESLTNDLNSEIARAKDAESTLQTNVTSVATDLATETNRAKAAEEALSKSVKGIGDRTSALESGLDNTNANLASEILRSQNKDAELAEKLDSTVEKIGKEVSRAVAKDESLTNDLNSEIARAKAAEGTLQTNVTAVATDLATETNRAKAAEEAISKSANGIGDRTLALESGLNNTNANLASEILRSQNKDTELAEKLDSTVKKIDNEISRAVAKDESLTNDLNSEIARAKDAESTLQTNVTAVATDLATETNRAKAAEEAISKSAKGIGDRTSALESGLDSTNTNLASETLRSQNKDAELAEKLDSTVKKIDNEISRAVAKDESLTTDLNSEIARAIAKEGELKTSFNSSFGSLTNTINSEVSRAQAAENTISLNLEAEKNRATTAEQEIKKSLATEVTKLENADARIESSLDDAKSQIADLKASTDIAYEDTTTVTLAKDANNVVRANAKVANADENIISLDSTLSGLYARVDLAYNAATNVLTLTTTNDTTEIKLNSASVLQSAHLDNEKNELVLMFQLTDGSTSTTRIPLGTLFNTWKAENQVANSAIELTKIDANPNTGVNYDILKARVLVSASDKNMLKIDGNSLFVDKSEVTAATENVTTLKNEVKKLETAFIGLQLEDGGGNYEYASDRPFISASKSWTGAIEILADQLEDTTNLLQNRHYVRVITDGEAIKHADSKYITDNVELISALADDTTAENNGYGNVSFKLDSMTEGSTWLSADVKIIECGSYEGEYRE